MFKRNNFSLLALFVLAGCTSAGVAPGSANSPAGAGTPPAAETASTIPVPKDIYKKSSAAIFEVIVPFEENDFVKYEKPLPFGNLPYKLRNDHYRSIGTAFAIGPNLFVSAAHVFTLQAQHFYKEFLLRDQNDKVFKLDSIVKYSNDRDLVEFTLQSPPADLHPLELKSTSEAADNIFVVGNALAEGISFRGGQISSYTPEEYDNRWKFIRFSAPASPGNSGGPLLNEAGQVIGVVVRKSETENLNYAVPVKELDNVSSTKAEFIVRKIPFYRDQIKDPKDYEFSTKLPDTPEHLNQVAEANIRKFYDDEYATLFSRTDHRFFPATSSFQEYLRHQVHVTTFGFLYRNPSSDQWEVTQPKFGRVPVPNQTESIWFAHGKNWQVFRIPRPENVKLTDFIEDSQLQMEKILSITMPTRRFGNEQVKITSLGKPQRQAKWNDSSGRTWLESSWTVPVVNTQFTTECLPIPVGVLCSLSYGAIDLTTFGLESVIHYSLNQAIVAYKANYAQWKDFMQLDEHLIPSALKNATFNLEAGKKLSISTENQKFVLENTKLSDKTLIDFRMTYELDTKARFEIETISVTPDKDEKKYFMISREFAPLPTSRENTKKYWTQASTKAGDFDEKAHTHGEWYRVIMPQAASNKSNKDVEKVVFAQCGDSVDNPKEALLSSCQEFRDLNFKN